MKNDETSQPSYKNDYTHYIKNPNILANKIVEIYAANPNAKVYTPKKGNNVRLQSVVNKINKYTNIDKQYKGFMKEFRNIPGNKEIEYDYEIYKDLILDRINNEDSASVIKDIGKNFIKSLTGQGINKYKMIKIDKDALKKYS